MELRGASVGRRLGAIAAGLLMTGGGQFVLGRHRRGATYVAVAFVTSLATAGAAFVSPTLMATLMLWAVAFYLLSLLDVCVARPGSVYPRGGVLAATLVSIFLLTRILPFAIRAYAVEAFRIPSGSMNPVLLSGDHVFLDKTNRTPVRGDVIVYRHPAEPSKELVKRVIGLPGDLVETKGNSLWINDVEQPHVFVENTEIYEADCQRTPATVSTETLDGARSYAILDLPRHESDFLDGQWRVPAGELFVMGDNRDNSMDSRRDRTVPFENVRGVGLFIYFSWDNCESRIRTERFGNRVR